MVKEKEERLKKLKGVVLFPEVVKKEEDNTLHLYTEFLYPTESEESFTFYLTPVRKQVVNIDKLSETDIENVLLEFNILVMALINKFKINTTQKDVKILSVEKDTTASILDAYEKAYKSIINFNKK